MKVTRAEYDSGKHQLRVEATGTDPAATLQVFEESTGSLIGTLSGSNGRYRGQLSWPRNPVRIVVRSDRGGSASADVALK